jgi:hypothetical protein
MNGCSIIRALPIAASVFLVAAASRVAGLEATVAIPETLVGIEGVYYVRHDGPLLARPVDDRSPVVLRVTRSVREGNSNVSELRYIGVRPGRHDLRDYLIDGAGQPARLSPLLVAVLETLPADHDGSLAVAELPRRSFVWPYREMLIGFLAAWLIATVFVVAKRLLRRTKSTVTALTPPLTVLDRLQSLVAAAIAGQLAPEEQARLESLLLAQWREEMQLGEVSLAESLDQMRSHPTLGRPLAELERWLHARPGSDRANVTALLERYRPVAIESRV